MSGSFSSLNIDIPKGVSLFPQSYTLRWISGFNKSYFLLGHPSAASLICGPNQNTRAADKAKCSNNQSSSHRSTDREIRVV